ncbi:MAG: alpha-2-macroglobulin family protein, partial [Bauldia sp.]|nr:alpha-2-macroglobulin family protein [Bauldia sp.]
MALASKAFIAVLLFLGFSAAQAADPRIVLMPGTDLPGHDYSTIQNIELRACEAACLDDRTCRAFTYNEQARWCFLKTDFGRPVDFTRATSGRVVTAALPADIENDRAAELDFVPADYKYEADRLINDLPRAYAPPAEATYGGLVDDGERALRGDNFNSALVAFGQALALASEDPALWLNFAEAARAFAVSPNANRYDLLWRATGASINAYLRSETRAERAVALAAIGMALELREAWRPTIAAYRASIALIDNSDLQQRLDRVIAEHGFRIVSNEVDADSASPRICIVFSDPLPVGNSALSDFVTVDNSPQVAIEPEDRQICLTGVQHGNRYHIRVRSGLPSVDGEQLQRTAELDVYVRDRSPWVGFAGNAYVLPGGPGAAIPLSSINTETAEAIIYRIGDRSIAAAVRDGIFMQQLDGYQAEELANTQGEEIWTGEVDIEPSLNATVVTSIPVSEVLPEIEPGVYVITAKVKSDQSDYWDPISTQWFVVSDLGVTTLTGTDGVHALVRSLATAEPVAGANVRLVAVNNEILGEAVTDADGHAVFAPGLARGTGGRAPQLVTVETEGGDYAFLDVRRTPFDLTDRGVDGRPAPGPLDVFMTAERGVYRPGETAFITALLRDQRANAVAGVPLTFVVERPDGHEQSRSVIDDGGLGGYFFAYQFIDDAMRGSWTVSVYADPRGRALATASVLVEDFEPERLAFEVTAPDEPFTIDPPPQLAVSARYLYGATAPDLMIEGDIVLRPTSRSPAYPGFTFGREDDPIETYRESLGVIAQTDENGEALIDLYIPETQPTTRLLSAEAIVRLVDTTGRFVERRLSRPLLANGNRIGIRPQFGDYGAPEGGDAAFDLIAIGPDGERIALDGVNWTLSRVETNYQWYRANGFWQWEPITTTRRIADGTVDIAAGAPAVVSGPVDWGNYLLEVESGGADATSSSYDFYAGWYVAEAGSDTPDTLSVALDKPAYQIGDTAQLRLEPRFAGTALVMVIDDRLIDMKAVEVPAEGTSIDLAVTEAWGPGAYVTAALYRPMNVEEERMPARALGLAWATVDPGDRVLDVTLGVEDEIRPRGPMEIPVSIANLAPGEEAYVTVAAVDLGILNLTNYQPPAPDEYYFAQRRLGMEIRDLYGQLIDRMQGIPGVVRSGGDGGGARLGSPPPTSVLVAFHSGIVRVGPDGTATATFDMPDFNGTARVMVQAWSAEGVGHAVKDVIVRDPVVVTASVPRFLHVGDRSRLLVEINNVAGVAGDYSVGIDVGSGILLANGAEQTVTLAEAARTSLDLPIAGTSIGDFPIRVTLTTPDGEAYTKDILLGVRPAGQPTYRSELVALAPDGSLSIGMDRLADFLPGTGEATLALGGLGRLDVPNLLVKLDRYPYGCVEQLTSRALPLLYLNEVAEAIGLGTDEALAERIRNAIRRILANQDSSGSFGLWGPYSSGDLWLDAYVTEFLVRAESEGYEIPELAMTMALDNLSNQVAYATDFSNGGQGIAYALYVLARDGRAAIGDLRYYLEAKLDDFATPLAKAQLGAALALYGDRPRAGTAFRAALSDLDGARDGTDWRRDYGTVLRDTAAVLALAAEFEAPGVDLADLTVQVSELRDARRWTSTQEDVWTLLAAASLARGSADGTVTVDGTPLTGNVFQRFDALRLASLPVTVVNTGNRPTDAQVTVTGIPVRPEPASS